MYICTYIYVLYYHMSGLYEAITLEPSEIIEVGNIYIYTCLSISIYKCTQISIYVCVCTYEYNVGFGDNRGQEGIPYV
jgi:hypothetical protein